VPLIWTPTLTPQAANKDSLPMPAFISNPDNPKEPAKIPILKHASRLGISLSEYNPNKSVIGIHASWMARLKDENDNLWETIDHGIAKGAFTHADKIIFDCSWEGWQYNESDYSILHALLDRRGIKRCNVSIISQNLDHQNRYNHTFGANQLRLLSFNSPIAELSHRYAETYVYKGGIDMLLDSVSTSSLRNASKSVLCMNNMLKPHRLALSFAVNQLCDNDCMMSCAKPADDDSNLVGYAKSYINNTALPTSNLDTFVSSLPRIIDSSPGTFETRDIGTFSFFDLEHISCFATAISESEMSEDSPIRITEKTIKTLAIGRPFVLFGNQGSLDYIKQLGFKTMEEVIDEDYDNIYSKHERFAKALAALETLIKIKRDKKDDKLISSLSLVCEHNIRHMAEGFSDICRRSLFEVLTSAAD
jgi:hypothetical protein